MLVEESPDSCEESKGLGVFAFVITWNRKNLLLECLAAILKQTHPVSRIMVIDNGSTDGTYCALGENGWLDNPLFEYIRLDRNYGPAYAFHIGFEQALTNGCEWLWVMDDDVIAQPDALEHLVKAYTENFATRRSVGFLVSRAFSPNGGVMNVPDPDLRPTSTGYSDWNHLLDKGLVKIRKATFVSILFPTTTLADFGVPRKEFFMWGEDIDYTLAITEKRPGYQVGASKVLHCRSSSKPPSVKDETNPHRVNLLYFYYRNQFYIKRKYYAFPFVANQVLISGRAIIIAIFKKPFSFSRVRAVVSGVVAGIFFNPPSKTCHSLSHSADKVVLR
jgi:dTDP-4-dehydrorhamnose reductase